MCLSTVYKNTMEEASIAMKNVMRIDCRDGQVILTDLMDRTLVIQGQLEQANLVDGFVIVKESVC
ncbi:MAG: CooT family nickel-binding protein [Oscillospiraceae bacterium]|nr:CooT family nickel-binding protein [Oscillospiraceae bacterium]